MDLTREALLNGDHAAPVPVDIPDRGRVYVRTLKAREQIAMESLDKAELPGRYIMACVVKSETDPSPLFSDGDLDALLEMDFPLFARLFLECTKANNTEEMAGMMRDFGVEVPGIESTDSPSLSVVHPGS